MKTYKFSAVLVVMAIFSVVFSGCGAQQIEEYGLIRKYNVVTLEELVANPGMFSHVPVKFRALMGKTADVFVTMNTHFSGTENVNFGVWPEGAKLWLEEESRDKYHPLLYLTKDSDYFALFRDIKQYEVVDIYGVIEDTYAGQPWIKVNAIKRAQNPRTKENLNHYSTESLFYIKNAMEYEKENELDFAIEDYTKALNLDLPLPAQIQISYKIGSLYFKQENWEMSKKLLTQCVELKGKEPHYEAYALLGEVYRQLEDYNKAVENSKLALDVKPDYYPALRTYGISLAKRKVNPDFVEAERKCKRALKFDPTDPNTNWYLGQIFGMQDKFNESIKYYKKAIDYYPQNYKFHKGLGMIHHRRSNSAGIMKSQAVSDKRVALHEFDIVKTILSRTDYKDADVYYFSGVVKEEIAEILNSEGKPEEAALSIKEATENFEECVKIDVNYNKAWDHLAMRYVGYKRFKDAVEVYDNLARLNPEDIGIPIRKAVIIFEYIKDTDQAIKTLEDALALNDDDVEANFLSGNYYLAKAMTLKESDAAPAERDDVLNKAVYFLEKAGKLSRSSDIRVQRDLIYAYTEKGADKNVVRAYDIFAELMKDEKKAKLISKEELIQVLNKTATAYASLRKEEEASKLWQECLKLDSKQESVHSALGWFYLSSEKTYRKALEHAKEAVALKSSAENLDLYAWVKVQMNDNAEAMKVYEKIDQFKDKNPMIRYHIGVVYLNLGNKVKAKAYLSNDKVLDNPDFGRDARKALKQASR